MFTRIMLPAIAVILLTLPYHIKAQQLFDLGIKGGVNSDDLSTSYSHQPLMGGHVGLFARIKPPVLPGVQGEALLSSAGTSLEVEGLRADLRLVELQLPLFAVFAAGPVELHAGGYHSRHLTRSLNTDLSIDLEGEQVGIADLRDGSFGLLIGAGLRLSRFYASARYNHGLEPIGTGSYLEDVKNRQFQFSLGYGFFK
jgi:hypothetical protein